MTQKKFAIEFLKTLSSARKKMHSGWIVGRIGELWAWGVAHHSSDAFTDKLDVSYVAAHRRRLPAVALESFQNLLALEAIWRLHVTDGVHGVSSSTKRAAESARGDIADP